MRLSIIIIVLAFCFNFVICRRSKNDQENQQQQKPSVKFTFEPSNSLTLERNSSKVITIKLDTITSGDFKEFDEFKVSFVYGNENTLSNGTSMIQPIDPIVFSTNSNSSNKTRQIKLETLDQAGHLVIGLESDDVTIPLSEVFRLSIIHADYLETITAVIGWIYFVAWSVSFYPQIISNFRLKDVTGLSFDFTSMNLLGFTCYSVFNLALYYSSAVQHDYFANHPRGTNPVQFNDVLFSLHAFALTLITLIQCALYRKVNKRVSRPIVGLLVAMCAFLLISALALRVGTISLLTYVYFFSYVKLAITMIKYVPQVWLNFRRQSTAGWNIINVLLDFTGGSFSLLQMFFLAYNYNDWSSIFGSPTKLGLGLLSIFFDLVFITQHYCLYGGKNAQYSGAGEGRSRVDSRERLINETNSSNPNYSYNEENEDGD